MLIINILNKKQYFRFILISFLVGTSNTEKLNTFKYTNDESLSTKSWLLL